MRPRTRTAICHCSLLCAFGSKRASPARRLSNHTAVSLGSIRGDAVRLHAVMVSPTMALPAALERALRALASRPGPAGIPVAAASAARSSGMHLANRFGSQPGPSPSRARPRRRRPDASARGCVPDRRPEPGASVAPGCAPERAIAWTAEARLAASAPRPRAPWRLGLRSPESGAVRRNRRDALRRVEDVDAKLGTSYPRGAAAAASDTACPPIWSTRGHLVVG